MTKVGALMVALEQAGKRGLSRRECTSLVGSWYGMRLREIEERGCVLKYHRGRYGRAWFRVELRYAPPPEPAVEDPPAPPALFEPPPAPPRSALTVDVAA